eukprot:CAMPEP_0206600934 /NCGR_PEP_ID=MMETSP0325_2-20121206/46193_1 /ASSEMBLY_ACC=CAM_ASM_000347 /TAXON_ID=2866 /ORGANISM="Crypthecodinium cohnii, Strain Seligo" /LENGTH=152 /DNA_ID=CAMNT_0054112537 /DNA_START=103 /DNA_END=558 /DNA_ORIENTATION=-
MAGMLEQKGIHFGVHDMRAGARSRDEYHGLLQTHVGDTRSRIFGIDNMQGTFNSRTRALSYGVPGHDPKSEYKPGQRPPIQLQLDHATPYAVRGGRSFHFKSSEDAAERHRRGGSLGRNIVGNCSVKDDRFVYYGANGTGHYGLNSGTHNTS